MVEQLQLFNGYEPRQCFCGSTTFRIKKTTPSGRSTQHKKIMFQLLCEVCNARGPTAYMAHYAIYKWNTFISNDYKNDLLKGR